MLLQRVSFVLLTFILFSSIVTSAWPHCHDSSSCGDLPDDIWSGWHWDEPKDNEVAYVVNTTTYNNRPDLTTDADYAASYWHRIEFDGKIVAFGLVRNGQTTTDDRPGTMDGHNVIGWGSLDWSSRKKTGGKAHIKRNRTTLIISEADITIKKASKINIA